MRRSLSYLDGLGAGIAAMAIVAVCWLAVRSSSIAAMYAELGDAALPAATRVALHPAWRIGVPVALLALFGWLHVRRGRVGTLLGLAVGALAVAAFWYWAAWAPIFAVADRVR